MPGACPLRPPARRDTEDMMARVGRTETESNDAWRRIEEQLRGLARRLDSVERSHSESNRVLSRTAQEINISRPRTGPGLRPAGPECDGAERAAGAAGTLRRQ